MAPHNCVLGPANSLRRSCVSSALAALEDETGLKKFKLPKHAFETKKVLQYFKDLWGFTQACLDVKAWLDVKACLDFKACLE